MSSPPLSSPSHQDQFDQKHCHKCHQHHILTRECNLCHHNYCPNHLRYELHDCQEAWRIRNEKVPTCPICKKMIDDKANINQNLLPRPGNDIQRINYIVSQHIESGCKRFVIKERKKKLCEMENCDQKRMMRCKFCRKWLCLQHRHQDDHNCKASSKGSSSGGWKKALNPFLARAHAARQERAAGKSSSSRSGSSSKSNLQVFENSSGDPIGQKSIENEDRVYLDVFYPYRSKRRPVHFFFSRKWPVGKVLDRIASHGKLHNQNADTSDPSQRLVLYVLPNGTPLDTSMKLQECIDDRLLQKRGRTSVILEYGPNLDEEVRQMAVGVLNGKKPKVIDLTGDGDGDCIIS